MLKKCILGREVHVEKGKAVQDFVSTANSGLETKIVEIRGNIKNKSLVEIVGFPN